MKKSVLLGVSISAILSATGANAAGYTCEELIEYTSCMPGYYLVDTKNGTTFMGCPDGWTMYTNGICWEQGFESLSSYTTQAECEANAGNTSGEDYRWIPGTVCVDGEINEEMSDYTTELVEKDALSADCLECPVGSICAGGAAVATPCPAGSYCAAAGLSQPSGQCAKGTYSTGGATACTSCPTSGLTDANGNIVSVTTESTGSTSSSACFIAKGTLFKDNKGIYRYTDNCTYDNFDILGDRFYESANGTCAGGYQYMEAYEGGNGRNDDDMVISVTGCYKIPDNEKWCSDVEGSWDGESCTCEFEWFGDTEGIYYCTNS